MRETMARIIDPDAWHETLPADGCGEYWIGRRNKAKTKADAIIAALAPEPAGGDVTHQDVSLGQVVYRDFLAGKLDSGGEYEGEECAIEAAARSRRRAEQEAERRVAAFAVALEAADFSNVSGALNERMCCTGQECGCMGSTVGQYLAYELREALRAKARDGGGE